jgi:hypothetical protein
MLTLHSNTVTESEICEMHTGTAMRTCILECTVCMTVPAHILSESTKLRAELSTFSPLAIKVIKDARVCGLACPPRQLHDGHTHKKKKHTKDQGVEG